MTPSESIKGEIPVITRLAFGFEKLSLFLTSERLIVAHVGKRGFGALTASSLLGRLSQGLEDLFKSRKESLKKLKTDQLTPVMILSADRDNFYVRYEDIIRIELAESVRAAHITIVSRQDKFQFLTEMGFDSVRRLLEEVAGDKIDVTHRET